MAIEKPMIPFTADDDVIDEDINVEIVNPEGTGYPSLPISARFAPFPPKIFFGIFILSVTSSSIH